jgi:cell division protein FtsL
MSGPMRTGSEKNILINKIKLILLLGLILFASLTIGSTFAYVSWHQSTGLYQVFIPLAFILGLYSNSIFLLDFSRVNKIFLITFIVITLTAISLRTVLALEKRATDWNNAFKTNYCLIKNDPKAKLVGADMLYPGFNLGIEDVSKWEWMRNGYANWVSNPNFKSNIKCSSN